MEFWKNLKISAKLNILTAVAAVGLIAFAMLAFSTLNQIRVGSKMSQRNQVSLDLASEYENNTQALIFPHPWALQAMETSDPAVVKDLAGKIRKAHDSFESDYAKFAAEVPSGQLRDLLTGDEHSTTESWYALAEGKFFPALASGDKDAARKLWIEQMQPLFQKNSDSIDQISILTDAWTAENNRQSMAMVSTKTWTMAIVAGLILLVLVALGDIGKQFATNPTAGPQWVQGPVGIASDVGQVASQPNALMLLLLGAAVEHEAQQARAATAAIPIPISAVRW